MKIVKKTTKFVKKYFFRAIFFLIGTRVLCQWRNSSVENKGTPAVRQRYKL